MSHLRKSSQPARALRGLLAIAAVAIAYSAVASAQRPNGPRQTSTAVAGPAPRGPEMPLDVISRPYGVFVFTDDVISRPITAATYTSDVLSRASTVSSYQADTNSRSVTAFTYSPDLISRAVLTANCTVVASGIVGCPDCDNNGILDACDIDCTAFDGQCNVMGCGTSDDCNVNGRPDECETDPCPIVDCNLNGIDDACDLACGAPGGPCDIPGCGQSTDCNTNAIPDDCELDTDADGVINACDNCPIVANPGQADCDNDGVGDACVIADCPPGDPSCADCNTNGIPDECETNPCLAMDCNQNGIEDACDLACGAPGGPCDVPGCGQSTDCNTNGIPDNCEPDSDADGIIDACDNCPDTPNPGQQNGDTDRIGDECDNCPFVNNNSQGDSDHDQVGDACDACNGFDDSLDCNANGIVDGCELAACPSGDNSCADCNRNGIPDVCDITSGYDRDCYPLDAPNGIPDSCDIEVCPPDNVDCQDCNNNRVPDSCDIRDGTSEDILDNFDPTCDPQVTDCSDGIPDDCFFWNPDPQTTDGLWSTAANWSFNQVPNNLFGGNFSAVIGSTVVPAFLDINVALDSLVVAINAQVQVGGGDLSIETPSGITNNGQVAISNSHRVTAAANMMRLDGLAGILRLEDAAAELASATPADVIVNRSNIVGLGLLTAALLNQGVVDANSNAGSLIIDGTNSATNNAIFRASTGGTLDIARDVGGTGDTIARGGRVTVRPNTDVAGSCIDVPPGSVSFFDVGVTPAGAATFTAMEMNVTGGIATIANGSTLTVNGPVVICPDTGTDPMAVAELHIIGSTLNANSLSICPGGVLTVASEINLKGDFSIGMRDGTGERWSWGPGSTLTMLGPPSGGLPFMVYPLPVYLEAPSTDMGPGAAGGNNNFKFANIVVAPGIRLQLVDRITNGNSGLRESIYCDNLTLGANAVLDLNGVKLYVNGVAIGPGNPNHGGRIVDRAGRIPAPTTATPTR